MKKLLLQLVYFILSIVVLRAQDSIRHRIILIGDAGKINKQQKAVIVNASQHILQNKTTVLYLGDNIYPDGMALAGSPQQAETEEILRSQYEPMRSKGGTVYFVPGNHDWDRSGSQGLQKIKRQWQFLNEQQDSWLKLIPGNGCPDPIAINVSDSLAIIAFDSEWWLHPHNKTSTDGSCNCSTTVAVTTALQQLIVQNKHKIILLASHHPLQSYGLHGGYFSWKDHIFPLLAVNKYLYIPLPVIGSLYPLLRKTFSPRQDLHHRLYQDMINEINKACEGHLNVIRVAGHEHGLQLIKGAALQVVSGSGAKEAYVKKGEHALYVQGKSGFITADLHDGNKNIFTYYSISDTGSKVVFRYEKSYQP